MVSFCTREHGLVQAVAQGIGKPGSSLAPAVELFTLSQLFFAEARGADRLSQARVIEPFYPLRRDMTRYGHAAVACELIVRTTEPGQRVPGLFDMLVSYLRAMQSTGNPRLLSWAFELAYLQMSGIGPAIDRCPICGEACTGGAYVASHGGVVCGRCMPEAGPSLTISRGTVRTLGAMQHFDIDRLDRLHLAPATAEELGRLVRDHIRYHLDISLKSEKFVNGLSQWRPPPRRSAPDVEDGDGGDARDE